MKCWLIFTADSAEFEMTIIGLLHALPLGSAVFAGAGILMYLIYVSSEYHPSARQKRTPRE
jgi:hypothetical protein